ncbi:hypothetical protein TNIN_416541 [Trichonephila inaurata madagascariensis]|uniref:Uncharacterized protein n=1 Tax=Trichonephila inaurata madagascariensis TaxID=2747483 RepID=A0A8X6YS88_9ARAC|nr:hypothetical protein TNIN_416541 [Trichonephila inaurata madagascariensis]
MAVFSQFDGEWQWQGDGDKPWLNGLGDQVGCQQLLVSESTACHDLRGEDGSSYQHDGDCQAQEFAADHDDLK